MSFCEIRNIFESCGTLYNPNFKPLEFEGF